MKPDRLNALTDGVVAIAITIIVLELPLPEEPTLAGLRAVTPMLLAYLLSFINIGIYWNNHHHLLTTADRVDGCMLWANLALLFFLSLMPFVIRWIGEAGFAPLPCAAYGVVLVGGAISYQALEAAIIRLHGRGGALAAALGGEMKAKVSTVGYLAAIGLAFVNPLISIVIYVLVVAAWFVPDPRIERQLRAEHREDHS
ncbi:MAG TPA: TMEM175 family protein [Sphingomicrobium sp.]|nr:TMEM175 family protein [Sphingomicrobium sp.]